MEKSKKNNNSAYSQNASRDDGISQKTDDEVRRSQNDFYGRMLRVIWDFTFRLNPDLQYHDREDVVQDTLIRAWEKRNEFRGDSTLRTFMLGIAKNVLRQKVAKLEKSRLHFQDSDATDFPDCVSCTEDNTDIPGIWEIIQECEIKFSEKQRQIIQLLAAEGLSDKAAAERIGCSYTAFRNQLFIIRKKLKNFSKRYKQNRGFED